MGAHIVDGQFQSDKYPWCRPGFVPLKLTDPHARDLLERYASQKRSAADAVLWAQPAWCQSGFMVLACADPLAHGFLWEYAQRHRARDAEFSDDLQFALVRAGFVPPDNDELAPVVTATGSGKTSGRE